MCASAKKIQKSKSSEMILCLNCKLQTNASFHFLSLSVFIMKLTSFLLIASFVSSIVCNYQTRTGSIYNFGGDHNPIKDDKASLPKDDNSENLKPNKPHLSFNNAKFFGSFLINGDHNVMNAHPNNEDKPQSDQEQVDNRAQQSEVEFISSDKIAQGAKSNFF